MITGPIVIIEDDLDDQEILKELFEELGVKNQLVYFENGVKALEFLRNTTELPFIIICDINLPLLNGIEIRDAIFKDDYLRRKSIPFIFLTTTANKISVEAAYNMSVQGFFKKENSIQELKITIKTMIDYWSRCRHPHSH